MASIGEARAHRRLREDRDRMLADLAAKRGSRPDPRQRARRTIRTTKAIGSRFEAGRPRLRLIATLVALLVVLAGVFGKVVFMQSGGSAAALRSAGTRQWTRERTIPAQRGAIFDRNGDELAISVPAATVTVNPLQIEDPAGTVAALAPVLGFSDEQAAELLATIEAKRLPGATGAGFAYVARQIDPAVADQVAALKLVGVSTYAEDRRILPGGTVGLSVVGLTDIDGYGISGIERMYGANPDDSEGLVTQLLQGEAGKVSIEVDHSNRSIAGTESIIAPTVPGTDIITSLDRSVQHAVEQALIRRVNEAEAQGGQVVVMGVNGDIIAMASVERDERGVAVVSRGNWTAVGSYEPGSVGKVITIAGALEEGVVTPDRYFTVPWQYDCTRDPTNGILSDSHQHATEAMSVNDILAESSNVGTILVSKEMGLEKLYQYLTAFGLGEVSNLHFPGESAGLLKDWQRWEGTERCTMAYGHGLSATPLQMVAAVNVVANDGVYAAPRLVTATVAADGSVVDAAPTPTHQVLSQATAEQMQQIMRNVVCQDNGTAREARIDGLSIAGKTGTAYKVLANGTYRDDEGKSRYYASFVGFFPAEDPQVTLLVSIDDPGRAGMRSGAQAAVPLFRDLAPTITHELGIAPPAGSTDCDGS